MRSDEYKLPRRDFLMGGAAALASSAMIGGAAQGADNAPATAPAPADANEPTAVVVPNGKKLAWRMVNGVKVFHLIAQEVAHRFAPGLRAKCWGYNGSVHGPLIEAVEGDRVRIYVTNQLPEPTTVHWHGLSLPNGMDGVSGLTQKPIEPGKTFVYEFPLKQNGTFMYHPHHDEMTQIALGMSGLFVIHPARASAPAVERDFAIMLHEWRIDPGTSRPNPNEMTEFNVLTMNGKCFPGTEPLVVRTGQRVRIRLGNLGPMEHHSIHLHNYTFQVTGTDGGELPASARHPHTTVLVGVGQTQTIEFVADRPGDWALHCHMTHHGMNQMGHQFPNMIGMKSGDLDRKINRLLPAYMTMGQSGMGDMADMEMPVPSNSIPMKGAAGPFGYIGMGGMFTIVKVRDGITNYDDPGWYKHPPGTVAQLASAEQMRRDGVDVARATSP